MNPKPIDNLYLLKNRNHTVDTISCPAEEAAKWYAETTGSFQGGNENVLQLSVLSGLDLVSSELKFNFCQTMN